MSGFEQRDSQYENNYSHGILNRRNGIAMNNEETEFMRAMYNKKIENSDSSILGSIKRVCNRIKKTWNENGRVKFIVIAIMILIIMNTILISTEQFNITEDIKDSMAVTNGVYFTTTQFATVGYGDITPKTGIAKWCASLSHLVIFAIAVNLASEFGVKTAMERHLEEAVEMEKMITGMKNIEHKRQLELISADAEKQKMVAEKRELDAQRAKEELERKSNKVKEEAERKLNMLQRELNKRIREDKLKSNSKSCIVPENIIEGPTLDTITDKKKSNWDNIRAIKNLVLTKKHNTNNKVAVQTEVENNEETEDYFMGDTKEKKNDDEEIEVYNRRNANPTSNIANSIGLRHL